MAALASESVPLATSGARALRAAQLLRAAVLIAAGMAIAFTAQLHENVAFDIWLLAGGLALIAVATFFEYFVLRGTAESWWIAARAVVALGAAGALIAVSDSHGMALVAAVWAALTAVITLMRMLRGAQPRRVALPSLLLSLLLTVAVLAAGSDPVAVIGFFGAYAVLRGVFLAIAAFDTRAPQDSSESTPDADLGMLTTSGTKDD